MMTLRELVDDALAAPTPEPWPAEVEWLCVRRAQRGDELAWSAILRQFAPLMATRSEDHQAAAALGIVEAVRSATGPGQLRLALSARFSYQRDADALGLTLSATRAELHRYQRLMQDSGGDILRAVDQARAYKLAPEAVWRLKLAERALPLDDVGGDADIVAPEPATEADATLTQALLRLLPTDQRVVVELTYGFIDARPESTGRWQPSDVVVGRAAPYVADPPGSVPRLAPAEVRRLRTAALVTMREAVAYLHDLLEDDPQ